jgi:mercuric transport protein
MRKLFTSLVAFTLTGIASAASPTQVVFDVKNMTCVTCAFTIEAALDRAPGVTERRVDAKTATVAVTYDAELTTAAELARTITSAGFPAVARPTGG